MVLKARWCGLIQNICHCSKYTKLIHSLFHTLSGQQIADSLVRNALSGNRGGGGSGGSGGGGSGGGASDFFNSLRYGGLFNENNGHNANKPKVTVSGAGPGGMF